MKTLRYCLLAALILAAAFLVFLAPNRAAVNEEQLRRHINLGKAFYENPTTSRECVEEFQKALALNPDSVRERINLGLALLKAGSTKEGIAELQKAQQQAPEIPHTWFNLGIAYKKEGDFEAAITQFEQMAKLDPNEPITQYNLGALYKLKGRQEEAVARFEAAARLDPNLAAAQFQLYNAYRQAGRREEAAAALARFQELKKQQEGAAVPEDVDWSAYAEIYETREPRPLEPPGERELRLRAVELPAPSLDAASAGMTVLDADGDSQADLLVYSAGGIALYRNGREPMKTALSSLRGVRYVAAGDFDNDGLTDLCILLKEGAELWRNARGAFSPHQAELPQGDFAAAVWLDFDHDYDIDLFLLGERSVLVRNIGESGFEDFTRGFPFEPGRAIDGVAFRLVADTKGTDLLVAYADRAPVLYRDLLAGKFRAETLTALPAGASRLTIADLNHDGFFDLLATHGGRLLLSLNRKGSPAPAMPLSAQPPGVLADFQLRGSLDLLAESEIRFNDGLGEFVASTPIAGLPSLALGVAEDFTGDGKPDLAAVTSAGKAVLLINETPTKNRWLRVAVSGVKNLKQAPLAEIEVKVGALYQKQLFRGLPLTFGVRTASQVETVRITWPNALIQNEVNQPAGKPLRYEEKQLLSGSCPLIWTFNGKEFEFITDVLGVAPLGASDGEGSYFPVDHDEYVTIRGKSLQARDQHFEIRFTEELREITYADQIELTAVDHPAEFEIYTSEKWKSPPHPVHRLYGVKRRIAPRSAIDHRGQDQLAKILYQDKLHADGFERTKMFGVAEMHHLTLDFGPAAAPDNRAILVLSGWVDWADGSTFLAKSQERSGGLVAPYLQVRDDTGAWRTVVEDMGMPSGKPKSIVVDLTGLFLSASRQVRIVTNLCVYWNEIFLSEETAPPPARLHPLALRQATLRFRGFSRNIVDPKRTQPELFLYPNPQPTSLWNPTPVGMYTRYGDVRELLTEADDRFVIMGAGDEIRLLFDASLPDPPPGWRRDFLLRVTGYAKDGDLNTAYSQSVEPLPFRAMSRYPYPPGEEYPKNTIHNTYRKLYNTRPALRLIRPLAGH